MNDRLGKDGTGEWCQISANALEGKIRNCYTNNLDNYSFDKTKCLKCIHNSSNSTVRREWRLWQVCQQKCLSDKQTAYLCRAGASRSPADPKLVFVGEQYSHDNEATQIIKRAVMSLRMCKRITLIHTPQNRPHRKPPSTKTPKITTRHRRNTARSRKGTPSRRRILKN